MRETNPVTVRRLSSPLPASGQLVEVQVPLDHTFFDIAAEAEAELPEDALHSAVGGEDVGGYAAQAFGTPDLEELADEHSAEALALEVVADKDGELGLV